MEKGQYTLDVYRESTNSFLYDNIIVLYCIKMCYRLLILDMKITFVELNNRRFEFERFDSHRWITEKIYNFKHIEGYFWINIFKQLVFIVLM